MEFLLRKGLMKNAEYERSLNRQHRGGLVKCEMLFVKTWSSSCATCILIHFAGGMTNACLRDGCAGF
eukprot:1157983-Pelagomonas_calceolata.AAC.4